MRHGDKRSELKWKSEFARGAVGHIVAEPQTADNKESTEASHQCDRIIREKDRRDDHGAYRLHVK